jgi:hypothetical protein
MKLFGGGLMISFDDMVKTILELGGFITPEGAAIIIGREPGVEN